MLTICVWILIWAQQLSNSENFVALEKMAASDTIDAAIEAVDSSIYYEGVPEFKVDEHLDEIEGLNSQLESIQVNVDKHAGTEARWDLEQSHLTVVLF